MKEGEQSNCLWCGIPVPPRKKSKQPRKFCCKQHGVKFWAKNNPDKVKLAKKKTYLRIFRENGYITKIWPKRKVLRDWISSLKDVSCQDCLQKYPTYCMDFDHREGETKVEDVCRMVAYNYTKADIELEIAKCDIVCSNCHRIRTHERKHAKAKRRKEEDEEKKRELT